MDRIFAEHPDIDAVIHCAALIVVPDSVADPVGYYRANVVKSLEFAAICCARLRAADLQLLGRHLQSRRGPARRRRLGHRPAEPLRADQGGVRGDVRRHRRRRAAAGAVPAVYGNPIGADPKMRTGLQLRRPTHALGKMIQARDEGVPFVITGTNWPTRDGSGIRDYIHVWDLATAHVTALTGSTPCPGR